MYLRPNLSTTPYLKFQKPLHCTVLDLITGNFKASYFCKILEQFTRRAKPIPIIRYPDKQRSDKWSSTVIHNFSENVNNTVTNLNA